MFSFFQVLVLELGHGAFVVSDVAVGALACVQRVAVLESAEQGRLDLCWLLVGEGQGGAVGGEVGVEARFLTDIVHPGLVAVQDFVVLLGVFFASHILPAFIGFNRIANLVQVRERFGKFGCQETF